MISYLIRRLGIGVITLLLITFLVYGLVRNIPGTPFTSDMAQMNPSKMMSPEAVEKLNRLYGLDKPWYQAYFYWMSNVLQGDFGVSYSRNNKPVSTLILERMPATVLLSATSLVLAYLLSVPIGLWSSAKADSPAERTVSTFLYMLYSLPSFVAALYLQLLFYVKLGWLPLYGMTSDDYATLTTAGKAWDLLQHATLPVICFTYTSLAFYSRFIRANMQEVLRQDYIRTARAKGVSPRSIILKHAFRNTLIPFVTLVGLSLPALFSGAVILEQIFSWPGMGRLYFESIGQRDYNVIMGLTLMFSMLTLAGQLLADILYAVVDPRVTYN
ncbi:ABC transporter permease [Lacipirellula sp.]|uniref:ABC transporter permease n=1 Tax=Lacipirellula sp. TaxID=2691419 RepID=UPI003D106605